MECRATVSSTQPFLGIPIKPPFSGTRAGEWSACSRQTFSSTARRAPLSWGIVATRLAQLSGLGVESITIGVREGWMTYRELHGELTFHEAFGIRPIEIPDEAIGQRRVWREIASWPGRGR
jgi:hypothetical protein